MSKISEEEATIENNHGYTVIRIPSQEEGSEEFAYQSSSLWHNSKKEVTHKNRFVKPMIFSLPTHFIPILAMHFFFRKSNFGLYS